MAAQEWCSQVFQQYQRCEGPGLLFLRLPSDLKRRVGFGFIWDTNSSEIGDVDIFVHWTTIQGEVQFKSLAEGEMVEYDLGRGPKVRDPGKILQLLPLTRTLAGLSSFECDWSQWGQCARRSDGPYAPVSLAVSSCFLVFLGKLSSCACIPSNRLFAPGRFNPLAMGLRKSLPGLLSRLADRSCAVAISPYGLSPYGAHPAMDPAFAAHMMQSARYNPHAQASFYPVHPSLPSARNMPPPSAYQTLAPAEQRYTASSAGPDNSFAQPYQGRSLNAAAHPNAAIPTTVPSQSSAGRASLFPGYGAGPTTSTLSTTSFSNTFDSQPGPLYKQSSPLHAKASGASTDSLGLFSNGWRDGLRDGLA